MEKVDRGPKFGPLADSIVRLLYGNFFRSEVPQTPIARTGSRGFAALETKSTPEPPTSIRDLPAHRASLLQMIPVHGLDLDSGK